MTWNYRIIRHHTKHDDYYAVHEAYYENDKIWATTENPIAPKGDNKDDVIKTLRMMLNDVTKAPVLDEKDLPWYKKSKRKNK